MGGVSRQLAAGYFDAPQLRKANVLMPDKDIVRNICVVAPILLIIGSLPVPGEYYDFLRVSVFAASVYTGLYFYHEKSPIFMWLFIVIGLVFNPFAPIRLGGELYFYADWLSAAVFGSAFLVRASRSHKEPVYHGPDVYLRGKGREDFTEKDGLRTAIFMAVYLAVAVVGGYLFVRDLLGK